MGQPFKLHSSRGTWTSGGERVQCSAKGHFWTHADGQVLYHVRSGKSASARKGRRAGEQAGAASMAGPGGRDPRRQLLQSSRKAFPSSPRPAKLFPCHKPCWGWGGAPPLPQRKHFQNASTPPFPPLGSFPCLGHHFHPFPNQS